MRPPARTARPPEALVVRTHRTDQEIERYHYSADSWATLAPYILPQVTDLGLAPNGRSLIVSTQGAIADVQNLQPGGSMAREHKATLDLFEALGSSLDLRLVLERAYPLLLQLVPADHGALGVSSSGRPEDYEWIVANLPPAFFAAYPEMSRRPRASSISPARPHDFVRTSVTGQLNVVLQAGCLAHARRRAARGRAVAPPRLQHHRVAPGGPIAERDGADGADEGGVAAHRRPEAQRSSPFRFAEATDVAPWTAENTLLPNREHLLYPRFWPERKETPMVARRCSFLVITLLAGCTPTPAIRSEPPTSGPTATPAAPTAPAPASALDPSRGQEIGLGFQAFLSPWQEGGEEQDTPSMVPAAFRSSTPSLSRAQREAAKHRGAGTIRFSNDLSRAFVDVRIEGVDVSTVNMFHIHCGKPGILGPILVDFSLVTDLKKSLAGGVFSVELKDEHLVKTAEHGHDLMDAFTMGCLIQSPSLAGLKPAKVSTIAGMAEIAMERELYFNLHTTSQTYFGDIRGQIYPDLKAVR